MGRRPVGKVAMTGAERVRRHRLKHAAGAPVTKQRAPVTKQTPARTGRLLQRPSELDVLKAENVRLRALLREDPDAAKLRKKVVELQAETHSMRVAMKQIAKDRDRYRSVHLWLRRVDKRHLDRAAFLVLAKATHDDRLEKCTKAELAEASRIVLELRPLFEGHSK